MTAVVYIQGRRRCCPHVLFLQTTWRYAVAFERVLEYGSPASYPVVNAFLVASRGANVACYLVFLPIGLVDVYGFVVIAVNVSDAVLR